MNGFLVPVGDPDGLVQRMEELLDQPRQISRLQQGAAATPIPSLEEAERWSARLLLAGYPLFSLGMFSSILYGVLHGSKQNYRPGVLEAASILAWLILGVAGYGWLTAKVHPRRRSWFVVAGAALSVLIIIGIIWH